MLDDQVQSTDAASAGPAVAAADAAPKRTRSRRVAAELPVPSTEDQPKRTRSRRAPVAAEAPAPSTEDQPKRTRSRRAVVPAAEGNRPAEVDTAGAPAAAPAEAAPAKRTRGRQATVVAEPIPGLPEAAAPAATLPDAVPTTPAKRGRRSPKAAVVASGEHDQAALPAPLVDPIGEALQELSQNRPRVGRGRRGQRSEALDDLAAAIAGESPAEGARSDARHRTETADDAADPTATREADHGHEEESASQRRRRRRGGRRHRRGADAAEPEIEDNGGEFDVAEDTAVTSGESDDAHRRRRRRRRRGEDTGDGADDPSVVVIDRVREPRGSSSDEVTGIEGSTRLEAKRQRRREGRAANRRRAPILSEAEFLARRESVRRSMVIRQRESYSQIAVLEDNILVEHYVDRAEATSLIGNVYLGRIQNVLPSMEAAFVDIGRGRNAVLFAGEVDWDALGVEGESRKVEGVFSSGQTVLVQVSKDPIGAKGARLTSHISIPGRYVVYAPGGHLSGISRKLADQERSRLKGILAELVGDDASVIIRTAAEGATNDELVHDINRLKAQWEVIEKKVAKGSAPQLLYSEPDLTMRIVRDLFTEDFAELVVDGDSSMTDAYDMVSAYVGQVAPNLADRVKRWDKTAGDLFAQYRIDEQIAKALDRKVHLPSGGTLIIDRTEAMTVIDVNTGKFTGSGGTLEATVTSNNLEAAEEIVRQLRLRDIGGMIVIDFVDMVLPSNRELLLRRLVECLSRDRTRHQVSEVTSLGLVQMTRKRVGTGLVEAFTQPCDQCGGLGYHRVGDPIEHPTSPDGGERSHRKGRNRT